MNPQKFLCDATKLNLAYLERSPYLTVVKEIW